MEDNNKYLKYYELIDQATSAEDLVSPNVTYIGGETKKVLYGGYEINEPLEIILNEGSPVIQEKFQNNKIQYTSTDGNIIQPNNSFGVEIVSNTCSNGNGVIVFDKDIDIIGVESFSGCTTLQTISIPNSVTSIETSAFANSSLSHIIIPDSVSSIDDKAFADCLSMSSILIPKSIDKLGHAIFSGTPLESIIVEPENTTYDSRDNCNAIIETSSNKLIQGCSNTIIPETVTSIGEYSFHYCFSLPSIEIPNSITSICEYAFCGCSSLDSIIIPDSVTSIDDGAFADTSLQSIEIPDSVISIGVCAFGFCKSLISIELSDNITNIRESTFSWCSTLQLIDIPELVTVIGEFAFYKCTSLGTATIGSSVTKIGQWAFHTCTSLETINFTGSMEQWEEIEKGYLWNKNVPATVVHCSDGDVEI